jgi:hypothetical protein
MSSTPDRTHRQILEALSGLLLALFVSTLASTVVSTALPRMLGALIILQLTLRLPIYRRDNAKIDYWGATLITAGVSLLLIWVSFVDDAFAWASWQTAAMVGGSILLLGVALWVESRVAEPIVPLHIIRQRATALAILGSLAAGTAMYGATVFLTQYFQISRGHTPAGLTADS